jgi:hypothetical protein
LTTKSRTCFTARRLDAAMNRKVGSGSV